MTVTRSLWCGCMSSFEGSESLAAGSREGASEVVGASGLSRWAQDIFHM